MSWWKKKKRQWENRPKRTINPLRGINPRELVSVSELCASGELPIPEKTIKAHCSKPFYQKTSMLPAFRIGKEWYTYRRAVQEWLFNSGNEPMREYVMRQAELAGDLAREEYSLPGVEPFPNARRFSLKAYCGTAVLPLSYRSMLKYCTGKARPRLKAEECGGHWMTSRIYISHWFAQCANHAVNWVNGKKASYRSPWLDCPEFLSLKKICADGLLPLSYRSAVRFCLNKRYKGHEKPALPAWLIDGQWYTTEEMLGIWIVRQGNLAADFKFDPRYRLR